MRECLREVAELLAVGRQLFRKETDVIRAREHLLEALVRLGERTDLREREHEPERADRERALAACHAVVRLVDAVAVDEGPSTELAFDRADGRDEARVAWADEPALREQEVGGVERFRPVALRERPEPRVPAAR